MAKPQVIGLIVVFIAMLTVSLTYSVAQMRLNGIEISNLDSKLSHTLIQLNQKTNEFQTIIGAFAMYSNMSIVNLDYPSWKLKSVEQYLINNIPQGMQIITYVNGTHVAAQIYFSESKTLSYPVLLGTYEELNIR